jgi:predicted GTPase
MFTVPIGSIKSAFTKALEALPDFSSLDYFAIGEIVDKTFKSLLKDLMDDFGMKAGEDYIDNLRTNEPGADFVVRSEKANKLIKCLLEGKVTVVKEHTRVSKNGKGYLVQAHFRIRK